MVADEQNSSSLIGLLGLPRAYFSIEGGSHLLPVGVESLITTSYNLISSQLH